MGISTLLSLSLFSMLVIIAHSSLAANLAKDIFILAGQSNMAGRGGLRGGRWDGNVPAECKRNPSILRLSVKNSREVAHEPLHADIDVGKTYGVGPGMAFANELRASSSRIGVVGLVPCAFSGTKISQRLKGTRLYGELVRQANVLVSEGGVIQAILWYQGESDTVRREETGAYKENMERLVVYLRTDLNIPSLLVIQSGGGQFVELVRKGQQKVKLANVKSVDAKGLRLESDHLHLTTISQAHLGMKLTHAFLSA